MASFTHQEHDELNFLSSDTIQMDGTPTSTVRRSLRVRQTRHSDANTSPIKRIQPRKRVLSFSATRNNLGQPSKKTKLCGKQLHQNTADSKLQKELRDGARNKWFYCHRSVVKPLLPSNSNFFINLEQELGNMTENISFLPIQPLYEQPYLVKGGQMKDYQLDGLSFLSSMNRNGINCILGDEMGLGKTLQTLSLFAHIRQNASGPSDPHLVICPLSVLSSWEAEAARWVPSMRVIRFHGSVNERERVKHIIRGHHEFDIMITTYDAFVADDGWFKNHRWSYCVLDEGHKIKNSDTSLAHKIQGIGSLFRLILTGTPVQNNLVELWSLLHWLFPTVFTDASKRLFNDSFDLSRGSYAISFMNAAKEFLSYIMLRRTKAIVAGDDVPPKEELTVFVPLTEIQRFWTYRLLTKMDAPDLRAIFTQTDKNKSEVGEIKSEGAQGHNGILATIENQVISDASKNDGGRQWTKLMNLLMQLRKVCDHPYLLPNAESEPYRIAEHIVSTSSKLIIIDKMLTDILPKGERVLIFSQWTGMLDILEDFMTLRGIPYARLDGTTSRPRRSLDIKLFQQEVSPYKVYLISTKAGGLGINLTKASNVILCDSDWNPQNDLQAIARAHRIGQTKIVKVYRLICQGSVEDQMLDRIRRKLFLSLKIMGSGSPSASDDSSLGFTEVLDILRKGSSALAESQHGMNLPRFLEANISDILQTSRDLQQTRDVKIKLEFPTDEKDPHDETLLQAAEEEEMRLLSGVAQVQSRLFEGQVVHKPKNSEIAQEWHDLQKRARFNRTVTIGNMTFLVSPVTDTVAAAPAQKSVRKTEKFQSQDWCNHCRDGGNVFLCSRCPRVFHASCRGLTEKEAQRGMVLCSQHNCAECHRSTSDSGGMLYRCRTCPMAFCEDCLPPGDIDAIGEVLPEFQVLNYGSVPTAYYIKCQACRDDYNENPNSLHWKEWTIEIREAEARLWESATD